MTHSSLLVEARAARARGSLGSLSPSVAPLSPVRASTIIRPLGEYMTIEELDNFIAFLDQLEESTRPANERDDDDGEESDE